MKKLPRFSLISLLAAALSAALLCGCQTGGEASLPSGTSVQASSAPASSQPEEEPITRLSCSVSAGALEITEGEAFSVSEGGRAYVEDGTYVVEEAETWTKHISVTVPAGYCFEQVHLSVTGGSLSAAGLHTQELVTDCDKGAVFYSGSLDKDAQVEQKKGETTLDLTGSRSDFNYELVYILGHIGLDGDAYAGKYGEIPIDNGMDRTVRVQCTMGSVSLLFHGEE